MQPGAKFIYSSFKLSIMQTSTVLKTQQAIINGKPSTVQTIKGNRHKQDIYYKVDGRVKSFNSFWRKRPILIEPSAN